ncbi:MULTISPECIES: helix-turn-helix domain-containing protein [Chryseobacterium]|uniref:helix-turn-helix domain-containing protein n=1 Tax=Chryseobacterium TaxID=59732 RepID=UPI001294F304|nr:MULTISPECIES: helix-turn-helix domain-containing protein [Chryseobacterium]MDR6919702.1 hypothetical protein [Chryseobacterium sp. 2987]
MEKKKPDYKRLYSDIIDQKYPEKKFECRKILEKGELSVLDIVSINRKIFGISDEETQTANQKYRSYKKSDIVQILDYQKKHNFNNSQLARHFKMSRNTIAKWRKLFVI